MMLGYYLHSIDLNVHIICKIIYTLYFLDHIQTKTDTT